MSDNYTPNEAFYPEDWATIPVADAVEQISGPDEDVAKEQAQESVAKGDETLA